MPKKKSGRRKFVQSSLIGSGLIGLMNPLQVFGSTPLRNANSDELKLNLAGYEYYRLKALIEGKVKIKNCRIDFTKSAIGDMNTEAFSGSQTYDISEIGLHPYMLAYANDNFRDYILLPIFPLRLFRHKSVFIRNDRGIQAPEDLRGKRIGSPGYSTTSLTWIRGFMQDEYGITPKDVKWVTSQKDSSADVAGKSSMQEQLIPEGLSIDSGPPGMDESEMLVSGEIDALFHAVEPKAYVEGNPVISRLFPDYRQTERQYFAKTGIFPIMHAVAIKVDLAEKHPWLVEAVFNAYSESKQAHYVFMRKYGWVFDSLPWYGQELEETQKLMGKNFWPYGIEPNRKTLEALFRYSYNQGLSKKHLTINELFHPSSLDLREG